MRTSPAPPLNRMMRGSSVQPSAQWAIAEAQARAEGRSVDFTRDIARSLLALTSSDIRTGAMAKKFLLPWIWFRGSYAVDEMVEKFEAAFGKGTLNLLPDHPRFVFCATDMAFGATRGPEDR